MARERAVHVRLRMPSWNLDVIAGPWLRTAHLTLHIWYESEKP
jgi:hypothetical protein